MSFGTKKISSQVLRKAIPAVLIVLLLIGLIWDDIKDQKLPQKLYGTPVVIEEPLEFNTTEITQVLDDGKNVYILSDPHGGYIQVYTLDGTYQHTLSFYHTLNGAFSIAITGNTFYVCDYHNNIYVFQNGIFEQFIVQANAQKILATNDFNAFSNNFEIKNGSVWRIDIDEPICIVDRSLRGFIYQHHLDWLLKVAIGITVAILAKRIHSKKTA